MASVAHWFIAATFHVAIIKRHEPISQNVIDAVCIVNFVSQLVNLDNYYCLSLLSKLEIRNNRSDHLIKRSLKLC